MCVTWRKIIVLERKIRSQFSFIHTHTHTHFNYSARLIEEENMPHSNDEWSNMIIIFFKKRFHLQRKQLQKLFIRFLHRVRA